jgi:hypothetical protein
VGTKEDERLEAEHPDDHLRRQYGLRPLTVRDARANNAGHRISEPCR